MKVTKRNDFKVPSWQYDFRFDGKRYRKAGYKTKKEAQLAGHERLKAAQNPINEPLEVKFKDYYNQWLKLNKKDRLSDGQYYWYTYSLDLFVELFGEDKELNTVTRTDFRHLLSKYGDGRTTESVRKVAQCIGACLRDAVYDGYIDKDPTYKVTPVGSVDAKKESEKYFTIEEYLKLIKFFDSKNHESYILLYMLAITGARFSEINQLTWDDLNYASDAIRVPGTKNETSDRIVEVDKSNLIKIKSKLISRPRRADGYLFRISHRAVLKTLKYAREQLGIESYRTPHALRHTHCSYLISKGVAIEYISKRLGHSSISITLEKYSHLLDEHRKEQAEKAIQLFK